MKTLTVRLSDRLIADIEAEARKRRISKSDVARERLERPEYNHACLRDIEDLIGSVSGLPTDLSARKKAYLRAGYGQKAPLLVQDQLAAASQAKACRQSRE